MPTPRVSPASQDPTSEPDSAVPPEAASAQTSVVTPTVDPTLMSLAGVEQELCTLAGQIAGATCRFLCLLADFDTRRGWKAVNVSSCAQWLSWRCGMDLRTAREHLRVARALARLPQVRDVFAAGRISYSKARAIARVGTAENEADLVAVALHAPAAHVERLTRGMRTAQEDGPEPGAGDQSQAGAGDGPEGADGSDGASSGDSSSRLSPSREPWFGTRWHWDDDGSFVFWGRLAPEDGARLLAGATRAQAERLRTQGPAGSDDHGGRDDEVHKQDVADAAGLADEVGGSAEPFVGSPHVVPAPPSDLSSALVAMAEMVCSGLEAPIYAPSAEVIVDVDLDTLLAAFGGDEKRQPSTGEVRSAGEHEDPVASPVAPAVPGDHEPQVAEGAAAGCGEKSSKGGNRTGDLPPLGRLDDGPALFVSTLRRLLDDGRLRTAVLAGDGRTLDLGRARRAVNGSQALALWRRDRGCAVPGCGRVRFLHAHHVVFWSRGGHTNLDNLVLLCAEHHRALHEGAFSISALGQQRFTFAAPDGSSYETAPSMSGTAADVASRHSEIGPEAIVSDWNGRSISLGGREGADPASRN